MSSPMNFARFGSRVNSGANDGLNPLRNISLGDEFFSQQVVALIRSRLADEHFGVDQLIRETGVSRSAFYRRFFCVLGQSPMDLIWEMRLRRASRLLRTGGARVSEIAYSVGFKNVSHFSKKFREKYGTSPSSFGRRQLLFPFVSSERENPFVRAPKRTLEPGQA